MFYAANVEAYTGHIVNDPLDTTALTNVLFSGADSDQNVRWISLQDG